MTFSDCPEIVRGLLLLWILLTGYLLMKSIWDMVRQRRSFAVVILPAAVYLFFWKLWRILRSSYWKHQPAGTGTAVTVWWTDRIPLIMLLLLLSVYTCYSLAVWIRMRRWRRGHLSAMSAKESLDTLPTGVCFYNDSGRVWLINRRMNEICRQLTGKELGDGLRFWRIISGGDVPAGTEVIRRGDNPLLRLPNGEVISFGRWRNEENRLWEINAADVTEEICRAEELAERNRELSRQAERLRDYSRQMVRLTREREEAEARAGIHDRLNRVVFATLHGLEEGAEEEKILSLWRGNLLLLEEEGKEKMDPENELREAAESIGLQLDWEGELPRDNPRRLLLMSAAGECMINAVRHGGAKRFVIRSGEDAIEFENDGKVSKEPVRLGSGLKAICRKAENLGGRVIVPEGEPFRLRIEFDGKMERRA